MCLPGQPPPVPATAADAAAMAQAALGWLAAADPATDTIPAHLRRAVTARDRHCRFPGCAQPPAACQPHHLIPGPRAARPAWATCCCCAPSTT